MLKRLCKVSKKPLFGFLITILSISTLNWIGIQFVATYCATWEWMGLIKNMLYLGSPVCMYVNHMQVKLAEYYIYIWTTAGAATISCITTRFISEKDNIREQSHK